jgi:hypothetical protein
VRQILKDLDQSPSSSEQICAAAILTPVARNIREFHFRKAAMESSSPKVTILKGGPRILAAFHANEEQCAGGNAPHV